MMHGVADDTSRFVCLVSALHNHLNLLGDLVTNPPRENKYNHVKRTIIQRLSLPTDQPFHDFIHTASLKDKSPSDLWHTLCAQVDSAVIPDVALWPLWLVKVPVELQLQLLPHSGAPIDERLRLADAAHHLLSSQGLLRFCNHARLRSDTLQMWHCRHSSAPRDSGNHNLCCVSTTANFVMWLICVAHLAVTQTSSTGRFRRRHLQG